MNIDELNEQIAALESKSDLTDEERRNLIKLMNKRMKLTEQEKKSQELAPSKPEFNKDMSFIMAASEHETIKHYLMSKGFYHPVKSMSDLNAELDAANKLVGEAQPGTDEFKERLDAAYLANEKVLRLEDNLREHVGIALTEFNVDINEIVNNSDG